MIRVKFTPPKDFVKDEERSGYFVSKKMKEVWSIEIDLAKELIRVCSKYNLKIWADYGSLLGASRHKGFIPWDDDIDFSMFREDYEKLRAVASQEFQHPYYFQVSDDVTEILGGCAKLRNSNTTAILKTEQIQNRKYRFNQGIFIDIFPLDNIPDNKNSARFQKIEALFLRTLAWSFAHLSIVYFDSKNIFFRIPKKIAHIIFQKPAKVLMKYFYKRFLSVCKKHNNTPTLKVAPIAFNMNIKASDRKNFNDIIRVPFEYTYLPCPREFDQRLCDLYGNWKVPQKLPNLHGDVIFDTNESYQKHLNDKL